MIERVWEISGERERDREGGREEGEGEGRERGRERKRERERERVGGRGIESRQQTTLLLILSQLF